MGVSIRQEDFEIKDGVLIKYQGKAQDVQVPDGVTAIGAGTFSDSSLSSIVLPEGLTSIGRRVFQRCDSLRSIIVQSLQPPVLDTELWYLKDEAASTAIEDPLVVFPIPDSILLFLKDTPPPAFIYVPPAALDDYRNTPAGRTTPTGCGP
jgi:hypothetical protein